MRSRRPKLAVVGHVEWVEFAYVDHVPGAGEIAHARAVFQEPAGGGAVVAVALARLAGAASLLTALGEDDLAGRARARLSHFGVDVRAASRPGPTRRALTLIDDDGERTITTLGERLDPSGAGDELGWADLADMDAVYFTAGDAEALHHARRAYVLVASPRARAALAADVELDALILSRRDATEFLGASAASARARARVVVSTDGASGGSWRAHDGTSGTWEPVAPPADPADSYGCGDSFAAGVTYGLGVGMRVEEAVALGARCAAVSLAGHGPYGRPLTPALAG
jgi:ribokinase